MNSDEMLLELQKLRSAIQNTEAAAASARDAAARAESRCDQAASVALGAVESMRHFQSALEAGHAQMGEMLAAQRKLVNIVSMLASPLKIAE
jgi:hypothetical protein